MIERVVPPTVKCHALSWMRNATHLPDDADRFNRWLYDPLPTRICVRPADGRYQISLFVFRSGFTGIALSPSLLTKQPPLKYRRR